MSGGDSAAVLVHLESLATVLAFAEERAGRPGGREAARSAALLTAIADLRTPLPPRAAPQAKSNESWCQE